MPEPAGRRAHLVNTRQFELAEPALVKLLSENVPDEIRQIAMLNLGALVGKSVEARERRLVPSVLTAGPTHDLAQQMRVRAVFDPDWRLNPAKVFPLDGRFVA